MLRDDPWLVQFSGKGVARLSLLSCITKIFSLSVFFLCSPSLPTLDLHFLSSQSPLIFLPFSLNHGSPTFWLGWATLSEEEMSWQEVSVAVSYRYAPRARLHRHDDGGRRRMSWARRHAVYRPQVAHA